MASAAAVFPDGRRWCKGGSSSSSPVTTAIFLFFFVVVVGVLVSARWITTTVSSEFSLFFLRFRNFSRAFMAMAIHQCLSDTSYFIGMSAESSVDHQSG
jgi:hypothetical protein